jgi:hypothetical protein
MKFLIIGACSLADGYKAMTDGISNLGHEIAFFPLFGAQQNKINNDNYNLSDEILKAINNEELTFKLDNYINESSNKTDYVIFWHNTDACCHFIDILSIIKENTNTKIIQINWDPNNNFEESTLKVFRYFDFIFSVNPKLVNYLRNEHNYNTAYHFNQTYSDEFSIRKKNMKYNCDVSILITNLYLDDLWKNKKICRKKIVDNIYNYPFINLHVYGPEFLKDLYPKSYRGFISYKNSNLVFSNSIVNLNISPVGDTLTDFIDDNKCYYYSERLAQILSCKGLAICDQDFGDFLIPNKEYILIDNEEDIVTLILDIKNNNKKKYDKVRLNGFKKSKELMNPENLGEYIIENI